MERQHTLISSQAQIKKTKSIDDVAEALDVEPVLNDQSFQQMGFVPKTGEFKVWRMV